MSGIFKKFFERFVPVLKDAGMSDKDISNLERDVVEKMKEEEPPKIAWVGLCGVGKSSTINALFNAGREIGDVVACTKKEAAVYGDVSEYLGSKGKIIVYDMPGLGEDIEADKKHLETYRRVLPNVDVVVWTISAGDRKMKPEQEALLTLKKTFGKKFTDRLVIVINKVDIVAPGETAWNTSVNLPSLEQQNNVEEFEKYVTSKVKKVLPRWTGNVISYSAKYRFRLDMLMTAIVQAVPLTRRWVYGQRADVADFTELIDPQHREYIMSMLKPQ